MAAQPVQEFHELGVCLFPTVLAESCNSDGRRCLKNTALGSQHAVDTFNNKLSFLPYHRHWIIPSVRMAVGKQQTDLSPQPPMPFVERQRLGFDLAFAVRPLTRSRNFFAPPAVSKLKRPISASAST